jgi:metal transporter CNNM
LKQAGKGGELTHDETTIIAGALELTEKKAKDAMTQICQTFAIDINAKLDRYHFIFNFIYAKSYVTVFFKLFVIQTFDFFHRELLQEVLEKGHSRVPVYYEKKTNIIGLILVMLFSVEISYAFLSKAYIFVISNVQYLKFGIH